MALAAIKGDKTLVELSEQCNVHAHQITQWKNQLLDRNDQSGTPAVVVETGRGTGYLPRQYLLLAKAARRAGIADAFCGQCSG